MNNKSCTQCKEVKSIDNFYFRKKRNVYVSKCKKCELYNASIRRKTSKYKKTHNEYMKGYYIKNKELITLKNKNYREKNKKELQIKRKDYYQQNKEYFKNISKQRRDNINKKIINGDLIKPNITKKKCLKCNKELDIENFYFRKKRNIYESRCKKCIIKKTRLYRKSNKEKINKRRRNLPKKKLNYIEKLKVNLRKRVNRLIKNRNKKNMYIDLLGCDYNMFLEWFKYNLDLDSHTCMNFSNYGKLWHIEHVVPCSSFDLSILEQQQKCFHWTNLRPLLSLDNLKKGNKIKKNDILLQEIRVIKFLKNIKNKKYNYNILNS